MSKILVRAKSGDFHGELDTSVMSDTIWLSLPKRFEINMLGSMIYFEWPLDCDIVGERVTKLKTGDIAYWPKAKAFCIFFGPTPLSDEDGEPVAPYPVVKIGSMIGDCSGLEDAGDRQKIYLERDF